MSRNLGYTGDICKIPETHKVDQMDYIMLPCSNEYLMIVLYDNPFDIIGSDLQCSGPM